MVNTGVWLTGLQLWRRMQLFVSLHCENWLAIKAGIATQESLAFVRCPLGVLRSTAFGEVLCAPICDDYLRKWLRRRLPEWASKTITTSRFRCGRFRSGEQTRGRIASCR
jgi:hypothetical protein